jgi:anti-sigma B factor antagonist
LTADPGGYRLRVSGAPSSNHPNAADHVRVDPQGHVVVSGDIDVVSAPSIEAALRQVEAQLEAVPDQPASAVVIDVTDVGFIDSSGLRALLSASRRNEQLDRRVVLRSPGNSLKRLLDITGTATMFDLD